MIKIFHMADLHLDSPFCSGDIKRSENARRRQRDVFRRITKHIRENEYDLVLIAGDLYDSGFVSVESAEMIKSELGSLQCPVVISPGNHDPYLRGSIYNSGALPKNVHVFNSENMDKFDFDELGVSVWGYAFCGPTHRQNPLADISIEGENINILCAHSEAGVPLSPYAPMTYGEMEQAGFTYCALGHIHKAPPVYQSPSVLCAYSGFTLGRAFDEIGPGSALSVSIFETGEKPQINIEKLSFSDYSFELLPLNVTLCLSNEEIVASILCKMAEKGYGKNHAVRVVLEGFLDSDFIPSLGLIERRCSDAVDYFEIKDNTLPLEDDDILSRDMTIRGEFYRLMKSKINYEGDNELIASALRIGLCALGGRDLSVFLDDGDSLNLDEEA